MAKQLCGPYEFKGVAMTAQLFTAYCKFLQVEVDKKLAKNPDFRWKSFQDFKKFAGAKNQNLFFENELEYL